MSNKLVIPTITAKELHGYRAQMELVESLSDFVHIDLASSDFFGADDLIEYDKAYLESGLIASVHIMYMNPLTVVSHFLSAARRPKMIILQVESDSKELLESIKLIKDAGVLLGLSFLQKSKIGDFSSLLSFADQVLIFSGNLGKHGGIADLSMIAKVKEVAEIDKDLEIAWDGGVNLDNIAELSKAGLDIFYVGGAIHKSEDPLMAMQSLREVLAQ